MSYHSSFNFPQVVTKDTNIVLATMATKILGQLASGLRKKYSPYAQQTIAACLQKFKERKPTVVAALRDTIDAASRSVSAIFFNFFQVSRTNATFDPVEIQ